MKSPLSMVIIGLVVLSGCGLRLVGEDAPEGSVTWQIDTLKGVGGFPTLLVGNPEVIDTPGGLAVLFDGNEDGLQVNANPIFEAESFTMELVLRPDPEGNLEQPCFHMREIGGENSVLLEIHGASDQWFLYSSIQSEGEFQSLAADSLRHSFGTWYHVALVYDGKMMRQYVNGREELSGAIRIVPFERGRTSLGTQMDLMGFFKGAILQARFTSRALGPKELMKR